MPSQLGGAPMCLKCNTRVYFKDEKSYMSRSWHKNCFKCEYCHKVLESGTANYEEDALLCNSCFRKMYAQKTSAEEPKETYENKEDPECCPKCGKRVYFAEQMPCLGRKWHKACFSCGLCSKKLDTSSAADHGGDVYCKSCYGRKFGPKGYGFAGGSGAGLSMDTGSAGEVVSNAPLTAQAYVAPVADKMNDMSLNESGENGSEDGIDNGTPKKPSRFGGGEYCPRCNRSVFIAERRQAAGHSYHEKCFTCNVCSKKLDSSHLSERGGEIFCKSCYGRQFGPKGYGFSGGAGGLQTV